MYKIVPFAFVTSLWLLVGLAAASATEMPAGSPTEQVAAIRAELESARASYVRKLEKAATTEERNRLMKEVPPSELFGERMLEVVKANPTDPAAVDALLWVVGNTPYGAKDSVNAKAKAMLIQGHADSEKLIPLAVALSWPASAADEDALRQLLARSQVDPVHGAATYALALQLLAQAEMTDVQQLRLETAADEAAKELIQKSFNKDLGPETAERLRSRSSKILTDEAERRLDEIVANEGYSRVEWPVDGRPVPLSELAQRNLYALRNLIPGKPAPATEGTDIDGKKFSLSDYRGKVVLLTFFGHWCAPCRGLYPVEHRLAVEYAKRPFTLFGVNSDKQRDLLRKVIETEKMTWPVAWDGGSIHGPLATQWNVKGWPLVVLIDHQGVIRYKFRGAPEAAVLTSLVERLVTEVEAAHIRADMK